MADHEAIRKALAEHCTFRDGNKGSYATMEWRAAANPWNVRDLLADRDRLAEEARSMRSGLLMLRNHTAASMNQIEMIDAALGQREAS